MSTPYTYTVKILHPTRNKTFYYYGVKYAKDCDPKDLGTKYKTSSKIIRTWIKRYGIDIMEFKVRKIFLSPNDAIAWEHKFLTRINAAARKNWVNQCNGGVYNKFNTHRIGVKLSEETKHKISETNKRVMQDKEIRQKISDSAKQRVWNQESKDKMSKRVSNTVWVKKNSDTKMIQLEELQNHLQDGWVKGRILNNAMKNPEIAKKNGLSRRRSLTLNDVVYGDYKKAATAVGKSPSHIQGLVKEGRAFFGPKGSGF